MIRVALVDDEKEHCDLLKSYLKKYKEENKTQFSIVEYRDGLSFVEEYDPDLDVIFLDIEMPHLNGYETAKRIRKKDSSVGIIFITNMAQYAIRGYEVNAIDFIVKPVGYYVFAEKLEKAIYFAQKGKEKYLVLNQEDSIAKLRLSEVTYIEKDKNYLIYHTEKESFRARGAIVSLEEKLKTEGFSKCINGCLVNFRYVVKATKDTVWIGETPLPISRQRRKEFKRELLEYMGGIY